MRIFYGLLVLADLFMVSCKNENMPVFGNESMIPPHNKQAVVLYTGTLPGGELGDSARGDVRVEKAGSKYWLVFKNFSSYNGPDLPVYFSKTIVNNAAPPVDYTDLGFLKYLGGAFHYELTGEPDAVHV